jgi:hypothetical protein
MTGRELLKQAEKYLGDKGNTFWKAYGYDHAVAWCCIWVWYVFKKQSAAIYSTIAVKCRM